MQRALCILAAPEARTFGWSRLVEKEKLPWERQHRQSKGEKKPKRAGKGCRNHAIEDDDTLTAAYRAQVLD